MAVLLSETKRFFADTENEAKAIVENIRNEHGTYVKAHSITKRTKREVDYFIVMITVEYYKIKDLLITE